jgi:CheY-like chemotaxis protein
VNARDAMPDGGQITIRTAEVEWDETAARLHAGAGAGCYVMLAVSDTGVGMNEETRRHIFEPFFTTKEIGRGTGLGLSTVQGIVTQSGGCVEVQSQPGRGATFRVYLPGIPAQPAEVAPLPEVFADTAGNETVLVVEDQSQVRNYAANVLTTYGYNVITAESGADALRQSELEAGRIDLVLTDVVMPHMRGRELASQLRRLRPGIKVLFMSGYDDPAEGTLGTREAGTGFIQKPFTPDELAARIHDLLGPR